MTDEQVESDMRALLAIAKPRAREALAEKIAARVDELFKGFDSEGAGYTGAAVPRKALRERIRADAEMLALLGRSGAWALYALKQLGEGGPTANITCTEFKAGLDSYVAARDSALAEAANTRARSPSTSASSGRCGGTTGSSGRSSGTWRGPSSTLGRPTRPSPPWTRP